MLANRAAWDPEGTQLDKQAVAPTKLPGTEYYVDMPTTMGNGCPLMVDRVAVAGKLL